MEASDSPANAERQLYAKEAGVDKLEPWTNLSWIDKYAKAYGILPRLVLSEKMGDVMPFLALWNQQNEYQERYIEVEKAMRPK